MRTRRSPRLEPRRCRAKANTRSAGDAARTDSSPEDLRADLARLSALIGLEWDRLIADQPAVSAKRALDLLTAAEVALLVGDSKTARKRLVALKRGLKRSTDITTPKTASCTSSIGNGSSLRAT